MQQVIMPALLLASLLTVDAWAQNIDWGQKSRSLDIRMSEDVVMKTLGQSPNQVSAGPCNVGPICKIHTYGNRNNQLIVRFVNVDGKWVSGSWDVFDHR